LGRMYAKWSGIRDVVSLGSVWCMGPSVRCLVSVYLEGSTCRLGPGARGACSVQTRGLLQCAGPPGMAEPLERLAGGVQCEAVGVVGVVGYSVA
jgi:hypothetical protein